MSKTGSKIPSSTLTKLKNRPKYKDFKHKYGAWYINPTKWNDCAHGKGEKALTTKGQVTSETERMRQEMSLALDETQKKLGKKFPSCLSRNSIALTWYKRTDKRVQKHCLFHITCNEQSNDDNLSS